MNLAAVDFEALGCQFTGNVSGGDGAKQLARLARLAGKAEHDGRELGGQLFCLNLFRGRAASGGGLHRIDDGLVGVSSLQRKLARQQKIAAVAIGDLYHVSAVAQMLYVFFQNHFHGKLSNLRRFWRVFLLMRASAMTDRIPSGAKAHQSCLPDVRAKARTLH